MFLTLNLNDLTGRKNLNHFLLVVIGFALVILLNLLISENTSEFAWIICAFLSISFYVLNLETLFCFWLTLFPIAGYLLRYPEQQAFITFERLFIVLFGIGAIFRLTKNKMAKLNLGLFELSWMFFALYALGDCLLQGNFSLSTLKTAVDGFILPLIFFVIVKNSLHIREISEKIFIGLVILAYYILFIGIIELFTGVDLLAYPGGQLLFDGRVRPNGPFLSDHSYALISLILALTLLYWPKVANLTVLGKYKVLWYGAIASAFLAALVPQFRAVMLMMVICLVLGRYLSSTWRSLVIPSIVLIVLVLAGTPIWLFLSDSKFYQQRIADTANFSSRVVTYKKALEVARENPFGVGLGNYENYFNGRWATKEQQEQQAKLTEKGKFGNIVQSTPHSNFLSVLAELGIVGFVLYLITHLILVYTAWRYSKKSNPVAGITVILLIIAYTGVGLTLTSGYYYDLNLFFFCCMGMLLGRGATEA